MQSIDEGELARIGKRIDKLLKDAPNMRRKLHEQMGDVAYNAVMQEVSRSTQRHTGNLQRWQSKYVGSGGGYAAVRAEKGLVGKNSPGILCTMSPLVPATGVWFTPCGGWRGAGGRR